MTYSEFEAFFRVSDETELWKFRLAYHSGREFINQYCVKFSRKESDWDFHHRKNVTYTPRYAAIAIQEIRNSVFQRMCDVSRSGGPKNYQKAVNGLNNGVDLLGSSMNHFMGVKALEELLVTAEFGIYVDKPPLAGETLADNTESPYIYLYCREDILAFEYDVGHNSNEFKTLLVRDYENRYDQNLGLSVQRVERFKLFRTVIIDGEPKVTVQMIDRPEGIELNSLGQPEMLFGEITVLDIDRIPFVLERIPQSFMTDIADAQIVLMNLTSADNWFLLRANFTLYVEPWDPKSEPGHIKKPEGTNEPEKGSNRIDLGPTSGRRYPIGSSAPQFISPSSEPLLASLKKQEQIKADIREMARASLMTLTDDAGSPNQKIEDGLAYLASILQHAENRIAEFWAMYENATPATVNYPESYTIQSSTDIREDIKVNMDIASKTTSQTLRKQILKSISRKLIGNKINPADLDKIYSEIERNPVVLADWQEIAKDIENGLVDNQTASTARGYPEEAANKAKIDHMDRLLRIQNAQTPVPLTQGMSGARGVGDQQVNPNDAKNEKTQSRDTTHDPNPTDKTRGPGIKKESN